MAEKTINKEIKLPSDNEEEDATPVAKTDEDS